jgi:transposase
MPRITVDQQNEILFLKPKLKYIRAVARHMGIDRETVKKYWEQEITTPPPQNQKPKWVLEIDWDYFKKEVKKGISIKTLYQEYSFIENLPAYENVARYFRLYHQTQESTEVSLRMDRTPGQSIEVDYSGDKMQILNPTTGEIYSAELFVAALSFSSYFYAEFTLTQKLPDFLNACKNALHFIGRVPIFIISDNCLTAVTKAEKYDAHLNKNFVDFCHHYTLVADPARVFKPKDKPHVENSIGVIQKEFFQKYRNTTFTSLHELNLTLRTYLIDKMKQIIPNRGCSRYDLLQKELPLMHDLPGKGFEFFNYKRCKVHPDCHIRHHRNYYSVPYRFVGKEVDVKFTEKMIYISFEGTDIALHQLGVSHSKFITNSEHYPEEKLLACNFHIQSQMARSKKVGPFTEALVNRLFLVARNHPLRNLSKVQGVLSLADSISVDALEYASEAALESNKLFYSYIKSCAGHYRPAQEKRTLLPNRQKEFVCLQGGLD